MNDTETLIMQAMERSETFAAQVAAEHRQAFSSQMREKFGADEIVLDEPYLPFLLVRAQLRYLRRMAKLEQRLQEAKAAPLYPDCCASYKDNDVSVPAQIEAETNRAAIEAKQDMDSARQQSFGVKGYIWRADGESCPVCAPRDGKIFTWGEGEAPGSIHPNCNCFAEPVAEGAGDSTPPRITGADIADMALLLASLIPAVRASRIGSAAVRGLGRVGQRVLDRARGNEKPPEAPKPQGKPPLRRDYEKEVKNLEKLEQKMRRDGKTNEEIARELSKQRREIGEKYKELTPKEMRDRIHQRNEKKYGDKLGPSVDELRRRGKSWEEIIESSKRPGGDDIF